MPFYSGQQMNGPALEAARHSTPRRVEFEMKVDSRQKRYEPKRSQSQDVLTLAHTEVPLLSLRTPSSFDPGQSGYSGW